MKVPRSDDDSKRFFRDHVPSDSRVTVRPMFGNESAFVNGNMFFGLFGNDLFVRLSDEDREDLLKQKGASLLEPVKGRPMKEYALLPKAWWMQPETIRRWVSRALNYAGQLPEKKASK